MKKLFITLIAITMALPISMALFAPIALAEDCLHDPIIDQNWTAEVMTGARLRDIPCMETSVVIATLPVGEIVQVIAETDGYYKIRRIDGTEGWVGQWLIEGTDIYYTPAGNDPTTEPISEPTERLYDIKGHKYEEAIRWMDENGIISGYPDLSFQPDGTLNRAEFMKIMSLTYDKAFPANDFLLVQEDYDTSCFKDIPTGQWYTTYICYAKEMGIIEGYADGNFEAYKDISRVEALKIVLKTLEMPMEETATVNYFADTDINQWYAPFVQAAYEINLIEESEGQDYHPAQEILRGEASNLVYQTFLLRTQ